MEHDAVFERLEHFISFSVQGRQLAERGTEFLDVEMFPEVLAIVGFWRAEEIIKDS